MTANVFNLQGQRATQRRLTSSPAAWLQRCRIGARHLRTGALSAVRVRAHATSIGATAGARLPHGPRSWPASVPAASGAKDPITWTKEQDAHRRHAPGGDPGRGAAQRPGRGVRLRIGRAQTAARQHLSGQGHARRAVAAGRLRRLRRQSPRLPGLQRNPSRLLSDPGRRPAGAAAGGGRGGGRGRGRGRCPRRGREAGGRPVGRARPRTRRRRAHRATSRRRRASPTSDAGTGRPRRPRRLHEPAPIRRARERSASRCSRTRQTSPQSAGKAQAARPKLAARRPRRGDRQRRRPRRPRP